MAADSSVEADRAWMRAHKEMAGNQEHDLILGRMIRQIPSQLGAPYNARTLAHMNAAVEAALIDASHFGLPDDIIRQAAASFTVQVYP